jgi:alkylhydroperoxidase family enzyme
MLAYVEKLTLTPAEVERADVEALRAAGFDDRAVLQIAQITSFFAYLNRMADGLGVGKR